MHGLYSGLLLWNVVLQAAFLGLGIAQESGSVLSSRSFQITAVFVSIFCLVVHSLLVIHFIGSMKWLEQSGPTAGIDDTKTLRRAWIKGPLFPLMIITMLVAVAVAILAGGTLFGQSPPWVYLTLAALGVVMNAALLPLARRGIDANTRRIRDMQALMATRIENGAVAAEPGETLLPESGRAGGKTLLFLAINAWVLYGYNRFVLRDPHEPIWPYAVASLVLGLTGWQLHRRYARSSERFAD